MQAGTQDLIDSDTPINPSSIPALVASKASNFVIWPDRTPSRTSCSTCAARTRRRDGQAPGAPGGRVRPGQGRPSGQGHRRPDVAQVINTAIPPGNVGYVNYNLYPDNNGAGQHAMCKTDLTKAGYPHGVTLTYMYPNDSSDTRIFTAIQASLAPCGITLTGKPEPGSSILRRPGQRAGEQQGRPVGHGPAIWFPDWFGNNGRTVIQALFQGPNCVVNTVNYGCYDNAA
jgi:peptide/nickel transport system substrate-binding protein